MNWSESAPTGMQHTRYTLAQCNCLAPSVHSYASCLAGLSEKLPLCHGERSDQGPAICLVYVAQRREFVATSDRNFGYVKEV
jgi:hypothetical protein